MPYSIHLLINISWFLKWAKDSDVGLCQDWCPNQCPWAPQTCWGHCFSSRVFSPCAGIRLLLRGVVGSVEGTAWAHVTCLFCFPTLRVNILTLKSNSEKFPLPYSEVMDNHILSTSLAESQIFSHFSLYLSVFHIAMKAVFHRIAVFSP